MSNTDGRIDVLTDACFDVFMLSFRIKSPGANDTIHRDPFSGSKMASFTSADANADAKQIWQIRSEARAGGFVVEPQDGVLT
jgi:hypothetical protein